MNGFLFILVSFLLYPLSSDSYIFSLKRFRHERCNLLQTGLKDFERHRCKQTKYCAEKIDQPKEGVDSYCSSSWIKSVLLKYSKSIRTYVHSLGVNSSRSTFQKNVLKLVSLTLITIIHFKTAPVKASGGFVNSINPSATGSRSGSWQSLALWGTLFTISAVLHSAESAITKLSTWKIQEFAEEEGPKSPFATLNKNITKFLITLLLTTTACSIYSTALFVAAINQLFPQLSLGAATAALTVITLFFGELLPKALAVSNSEYVARKIVPWINPYATFLSPLTSTVTWCSDLILRMFGMRSEEDHSVSEDMLRLVVDEAQRSNEGIESGEGRMIKNVLDMQDKEVGRIMQPRIEIIAVPETTTASDLLQLAVLTKYSRIPVYRSDIDHIVGIVFSKDLLDFIQLPGSSSLSGFDGTSIPLYTPSTTSTTTTTTGGGSEWSLPKLSNSWKNLTAKDLMETPYFIPETMSCWNALQEMRKRRVHMAIVVDEYGGTSGLVTFEDILEEVVGEIYDEDDDREEQSDDWTIFRRSDGTFQMKAYAEVDDVLEALQIDRERKEIEAISGEYSTIGGLLCSIAGRIPQEGDTINFSDYQFFIEKVEDNRRLVDILVSPRPTVSPTTSSNNNKSTGMGAGLANGIGAMDELDSFETESAMAELERGYQELNSRERQEIVEDEEVVEDNELYERDLNEINQEEGGSDRRKESQRNASSKSTNEERGSERRSGSDSSRAIPGESETDTSSSHSNSNNGSSSGLKQRKTSISANTGEEATVLLTPNGETTVKYDSKTSKLLIFIDGEWVDPDSL